MQAKPKPCLGRSEPGRAGGEFMEQIEITRPRVDKGMLSWLSHVHATKVALG